jgi:carbonic anhydrase
MSIAARTLSPRATLVRLIARQTTGTPGHRSAIGSCDDAGAHHESDRMTSEAFTPNTDELVANNLAYAADFDAVQLDVVPARHLAVVACMDSRMDVFKILGLANGEAHLLRNAGGVITDDVIRSLCLSQRSLGTREIVLLHHTDCGLQKVTEDSFKSQLEAEVGVRPHWALDAFADPYADVRQSIQRLLLTPFIPHKDHIRGFVYDVDDGLLHEVEPGEGGPAT